MKGLIQIFEYPSTKDQILFRQKKPLGLCKVSKLNYKDLHVKPAKVSF